jgi:hypothetical protein
VCSSDLAGPTTMSLLQADEAARSAMWGHFLAIVR